MKTIQVPGAQKASVIGRDGETTLEVSFAEFVTLHLDSYAEIKTPAQHRQVNKVLALLEKQGADKTPAVALEDADYALVKASIQKSAYVPRAARQLLAHVDAIESAEEVKG